MRPQTVFRRGPLPRVWRGADPGAVKLNRTLSCGSVSLIKAVMSWGRRRALVYFFDEGKLQRTSADAGRRGMASRVYGSSAIAAADKDICSR